MAIANPSGPFRAFHEEHYARVWRTLLRLGVPRSEVDDCTQEVFIAAHRHFAKVDRRAPRAWLFSAARYLAQREYRTRWRKHRSHDALAQALATGTRSTWERFEAATLLEQVLTQLPPNLREALVLAEVDGMTGREIATTLGVPEGTAATWLRKARLRARQIGDSKGERSPRPLRALLLAVPPHVQPPVAVSLGNPTWWLAGVAANAKAFAVTVASGLVILLGAHSAVAATPARPFTDSAVEPSPSRSSNRAHARANAMSASIAVRSPPIAPLPTPEATKAAPRRRQRVDGARQRDLLRKEQAATRAAIATLRQGDPSAALRMLAVASRQFPDGALAAERRMIKTEALCKLGRRADAGRLAADPTVCADR